MNKERLHEIVAEFKKGERTLYQRGSFHLNQGFTIFPKKNEDIEIDRPDKGQIYKHLSLKEARELADSPYCTNREAIMAFITEAQPELVERAPEK